MKITNQGNDGSPTIAHAGVHLLVTWCMAALLVFFAYAADRAESNIRVRVLVSILAGVCFLGCGLQVFVTIMAAIKARGWDYIGIFMLYGFWLCAALVAFFCLRESFIITDYFP
jgi:hypothetical protein